MNRVPIPPELRIKVAETAQYRCGYCLTPEWIAGTPMEIDHLIPVSLGGQTEENNLWLACSLCNKHKANRMTAVDPITGQHMPLFNPRWQIWQEHFQWAAKGAQIIGITPIGRATVAALRLNQPSLVNARRYWIQAGWHPPLR